MRERERGKKGRQRDMRKEDKTISDGRGTGEGKKMKKRKLFRTTKKINNECFYLGLQR